LKTLELEQFGQPHVVGPFQDCSNAFL